MSHPVGKGSILIRESADLPVVLRNQTEPYSKGWRTFIRLNRHGLDRYIGQEGWNLFFMAGDIAASAMGREGEQTTRRAVMNLTRDPEMRDYNCLEIARVSVRTFMKIPYVNVGANVCHVQHSATLARPKTASRRPGYASS